MMKHLITLLALSAITAMAAPADDFREAMAAKAAETPVVHGSDGWLYLPAELSHIAAGKFWGPEAVAVSKASKPEYADPLPAILDFKAQLDAAGVELILVPVPAKAFVYPEPLTGKPAEGRLDTVHQQFYELLRKEGVTVIDLLPDLLAAKAASSEPVYCKTDTHWSGVGIGIAADKITALLKDRPWLVAAEKTPTSTVDRSVEITGDLQGMAGGTKKESVALHFVGTAGSNGMTAVQSDRASPLVLLGDSHTLVFNAGADMHAVGAGLADQLANELGIPVDLIGVRGSGATPARINFMRRVRGDDTYLAGKKAVVWVFTVREFTESSGWRLVPLTRN